MNTKIRLIQLGKKQVDLLDELKRRGFSKLDPPTLSNIIARRINSPQAIAVREEIERILYEWEKGVEN